jgi:hypothetical protein
MPEDRKAYRLPITIHYDQEIGLDPEKLPEHRMKEIAAVECLQMCESLFWTVSQLGRVAAHGGWIYTDSDLFEALENLGNLGRAVAASAGEQVQHLKHVADKLHKTKRK